MLVGQRPCTHGDRNCIFGTFFSFFAYAQFVSHSQQLMNENTPILVFTMVLATSSHLSLHLALVYLSIDGSSQSLCQVISILLFCCFCINANNIFGARWSVQQIMTTGGWPMKRGRVHYLTKARAVGLDFTNSSIFCCSDSGFSNLVSSATGTKSRRSGTFTFPWRLSEVESSKPKNET